MPDQALARDLLLPLGEATLDAFANARRDYALVRASLVEQRARLDPAGLALTDGVNFWLVWSSYLTHNYEGIDSVRRLDGHPLEHVWMLDGRLQLRLKSDVYSLAVQPQLPGVGSALDGFLALSASANSQSATFVGMEGGHANWHLPAASLIGEVSTRLVTQRPKPSVRPTRSNTVRSAAE